MPYVVILKSQMLQKRIFKLLHGVHPRLRESYSYSENKWDLYNEVYSRKGIRSVAIYGVEDIDGNSRH